MPCFKIGFLFTFIKTASICLASHEGLPEWQIWRAGQCRHCPQHYTSHLHLIHVGKGCQSVRDSRTHWNLRVMEFVQTGPKVCRRTVTLWERCSGGSKLSNREVHNFFIRRLSYLSNWTRVTFAGSVFIQHQHPWRQLCVYLWISTYNSNINSKAFEVG